MKEEKTIGLIDWVMIDDAAVATPTEWVGG